MSPWIAFVIGVVVGVVVSGLSLTAYSLLVMASKGGRAHENLGD